MRVAIHNECRDDESEAFLADLLPGHGERMSRRLGMAFDQSVHVVLSSRADHRQRFPPDDVLLADVVDPEERESATEDVLRRRYPPEFYAHGIATTVRRKHNPPAGTVVGEAAIYLDVDTIRELAQRLAVSPEAVLAQVASHELAHVLRGHHQTDADTPLHGWLAEGDAQRDAWQSLTDALADPKWTTIAREGRAAQLRIAQHQPAAYSRFDASALDHAALLGDLPLPERRFWVAGTPRCLFDVMVETNTEVPVKGADVPNPGDLLYLGIFDTLVGPWMVMATRSEPRTGNTSDLRAVEVHAKQKPREAPEPVRWLQLRRLDEATAGDNPDVRVRGDLVAEPLSRERAKSLPAVLRDDIAVRAEALKTEFEADMAEYRANLARSKRPG